ncbi:hypothetical protein B0H14DRAFT_3533901 [Mycena olivaceomarginata]|nr:hypothetical protein B0H14DRAFT_3533901 [Mycena olivaceomarginata]
MFRNAESDTDFADLGQGYTPLRVHPETPLTRHHNSEELTELPFGYHSLVGVPGADLNYGETVVYANDAIRPAYLIVYAADVPPEVRVADLRSILSTLFKTPIAS